MSFDRAAAFYDATRGLPADVQARLTALLTAELASVETCLEIGVGTGRIALPLAAEGVSLIGVDIAPKMLQRLVDNAGGEQPFPLVVADVTELPFPDDRFGACLASHLLHLIPDWPACVDEAVRVLQPGAVLLVDFGRNPPAPWHSTTSAILRKNDVVLPRPGMTDPGPVADFLGARAVGRPLAPLSMTVDRTLAQDLADWEGRIHSWAWSATDEQIGSALEEARTWASDTGWPLDRKVELHRTIQWWAFDLVP
jgi:SAM-dependent methyltransferase